MSNLHVVKDGPSNIGDDPTAGRFSYVRGRIHDHADGATIRRDRFEVKASAKRGSGRGPTNDTGKERKEEDRPESTTTATRRSELTAHKRRSARGSLPLIAPTVAYCESIPSLSLLPF